MSGRVDWLHTIFESAVVKLLPPHLVAPAGGCGCVGSGARSAPAASKPIVASEPAAASAGDAPSLAPRSRARPASAGAASLLGWSSGGLPEPHAPTRNSI